MHHSELYRYSAQEVFSYIRNHLMTMPGQSGIPSRYGVKCLYRAPDGNKCAAGIFLTDEEAAGFDNRSKEDEYTDVSWSVLAGNGEVCKTHADMIRTFQIHHDRSENWSNNKFIGSLVAIANEYDVEDV